MKRYITWIGLTCLILFTGIFLPRVFAQTIPPQITMSVSPPTFELTGEKGETLTNVIKFENTNAFPLSIITSTRNFTAVGEEGAVGLTTEDTAFSLASWIAITPQATVVEPKSTTLFTYTITIPANAESGGHFGSIVFSTKPSQGTSQTGAVVTQELGDLILLKIPGATNLSWQIAGFNPVRTLFWVKPLQFTLRIKNTGNVHIKPAGRIVLTNVFGQTLSQDITSENVLPEAVRRFDITIFPPFLLGPYTARAIIDVNGQEKTATVTLWALPGKQLLVFGSLLLVLLVVSIKGRKRFTKAIRVLAGKE